MAAEWLVRPVAAGDIDAVVSLARALGPGMTTLPAVPDAIARKVADSLATFAGRPAECRQYLLVLEDGATGQLLGTSAIYPSVGDAHGFFSYKLTRLIQRSTELRRRYEIELLTLSNDYTGATEVGTLAVLPDLRGTRAGRLLARARYMLIAAFPDLFSTRVMAEMRGWQDEAGRSPFWDAIGARFFGMQFAEADRLSATDGAGFIADLMPKQPIYTALLPEEARQAIGRAHVLSARALALLIAEDFAYEAHVDVFDGGPQVHVERDRIRTVRECRALPVRIASPGAGARPLLIAGGALDGFRVVEAVGAMAADKVLLDRLPRGAAELGSASAVRVVSA